MNQPFQELNPKEVLTIFTVFLSNATQRITPSDVDFMRYGGFSDHTVGIHAAQIAMARGAKIIEKHFTLDKNMYGPDHACSMTPDELRALDAFRKDLEKSL